MGSDELQELIDYAEKTIKQHSNNFKFVLYQNEEIINERIFDSPRTNEEFNIFKLIVLDQEKYYCVVFTFFNSIEMERTIEWIYDDILKIICFKGNIQVNEIV
jgi:hypothetical protein